MALTPEELDLVMSDEDINHDAILIPQDDPVQDDATKLPVPGAPPTPPSDRPPSVLLSSVAEANAQLSKHYSRKPAVFTLPTLVQCELSGPRRDESTACQNGGRGDVNPAADANAEARAKWAQKQTEALLAAQQRQLDILENECLKTMFGEPPEPILMHFTPLTLEQATSQANALGRWDRQTKEPRRQPLLVQGPERLPFNESVIFPVYQAFADAAGYEPPHPDWPKYLQDVARLPPEPVDTVMKKQLILKDRDTFGHEVRISSIRHGSRPYTCGAPLHDCDPVKFRIKEVSEIACSFLVAGRGPRHTLTLPPMFLMEPMVGEDGALFAEMAEHGGTMRVPMVSSEGDLARGRETLRMREGTVFGDHPDGSFWQSR
ncbi:hypothetical protein BDV96DRAFT_604520 [Lophiotrema nucula]|uniref:Uncharacterized protein n=1 Tax=Lophiotrema nucula TaxID=690887 RepID=A0A6A5YT12_9PLEO|nr:hypothetical protein BDV96DRAFT_604520 [Lophiotrema nucula]